MLLDEALKQKILDVRVRDRLLAEGKLTQKELEEYLSQLPDESQNYEEVALPKQV